MDSQKRKALDDTYERIINVGLCIVPYEDVSDLVAPELMLFGTTKDEKVFSFSELDAMFKSQYEQMDGFVPALDRKRLFTRISYDGDNAFITEEVTLTISSPEVVNIIFIRCSCVMEYIDDQWKLTHWHASTPVETENDHWHIEEWKREKEKLQQLVDEQTIDLKLKNRELEVEAALERVRSKAMAMHRSGELADLSLELVKQVQALGMKSWFCAFNIYDDDPRGSLEWGSNGQGTFPTYRTPREGIFLRYYEAGQRGETFLVHEIGEEECPAHYEYLCSLPGVGEQLLQMKAAGIPFPTSQIDHVAFFKYGYVLFITFEPAPDSHEIFKRFAKVFEQTYTRFLDLKKAEGQARESQIELSLERIRAKVTAMRESSDLLDIVVTMRSEFVSLGHEAHYFWHMRWLTDRYDKAMTSGDGSRIGMVMSLPRHIHGDIQPVADWEKGNDPTYVLAMDSDTAVDYVHKMITLGDFEQVDPQSPTLNDIRRIGGLTFVMARTTHGEIGFSLPGVVPNPPSDSVDSLVRFATVFDLAYKRFEDLKFAEQQHREAQIELALERVRARSLAMYSTVELTEIIKCVDDQIKELNISNTGGAFIVINQELEDGFSCWGSGGVGNYVRKVDIPYIDRQIYHRLNDGIINRVPFFTEQYDEEEKHAFFRHLFSHPPFDVTPVVRQQALLTLSDGYTRSCVVSENTSIFIINHHGVPFSDEENDILRQMGRVFEQSYTRYLDIEKAENQAKLIREERDRLELALKELHATQSQLIQQEKLASLGQLTAGIAHEIKNPLNFVNNFSAVSLELVDEAMDEVAMIHTHSHTFQQDAAPDVKTHGRASLLQELLTDIKSNLTKIHEHGSRADGIVKSMLQHSRGGSGKMEPTDLNALVKEFTNLAYHGMRAGKNPIEAEVTIDLDDNIGEVPLVYEDFSRVILNICSNAFDAMRLSVINDQGSMIGDKEIATTGHPRHEGRGTGGGTAHLSVRTHRVGDRITIEIEDNGPGIPDDIKDKILQPFFTTKKGTQGTGLGLSITHDIVKAHGGELAIQSKPGQTVFVINLNKL